MDDFSREHLGNAIAAGIFVVCLMAFPGAFGFILAFIIVIGWIAVQFANQKK